MKTIKAVEVKRDEFGMWTHPEMPLWDEGTSQDEVKAWFSERGISYFMDCFESSCTDEQSDRWFQDGNTDCSDWEPTCDVKGSFLLSIHDTEDGPVGVFAVPLYVKVVG